MMLEFGRNAEDQRKDIIRNILYLPYSYSYSYSEPLAAEMETPEKGIPETSSKKKVSKKPKVQKLKEGMEKLKVLERHLKTDNETLINSSLKFGSALDQLAIKYETLKHKNKKLFKQNNRLQNVNKFLRFKLSHIRPKPLTHISLNTLAEAT
jgi:hypothetical protein